MKTTVNAAGHRGPVTGVDDPTQPPLSSTPSMVQAASRASRLASIGFVAGGSVGAALGFLASAGTVEIPGFSSFVAAGPWMAALAGLGFVGAVGMVLGALMARNPPPAQSEPETNHRTAPAVAMHPRQN